MKRKIREILLHKTVSKNYDKIREKQINSKYYSLKGIEELIRHLPMTKRTLQALVLATNP